MNSLFASADAGLVGLLFFFCVFVGVAIWAYTPKRKQEIESHKYIPFSEDENDRA